MSTDSAKNLSLQASEHNEDECMYVYKIMGHMWKLAKSWLQKWVKCKATPHDNSDNIIKSIKNIHFLPFRIQETTFYHFWKKIIPTD